MLRKKILLSFLALATIVSAMAFAKTEKTGLNLGTIKTTRVDFYYQFHYTGPSSPTSFNDFINPNNYVILAPGEGFNDYCEAGNDALCLINCQRIWNGTSWKPDFSDTSWGSTRSQLYDYYWYGLAGLSLYTKAVY